ncbi:MAG: LptF/LptG family permease [Rikenellaceae bacterium]
MKTVHKLILKSYLGPMIMTFFIVMFILVMQFMWRYIDELVGKGLTMGVICELLMYAAATLIPMGLPLATLLASIMTMGNLGENYELLALKSAGISLPKIMKPVFFVVLIISISSFFVANNLVPYATQKIYSILYDIRQQKQTMEFQDGIFFNGIENMSIRVGRQDPQTRLLTDVLIYDNRKANGDMTTTVADSGYINLSEDKRFLLVTLYSGETYEETRSYKWAKENILRYHKFNVQRGVIPLEGFDFQRSDASMFGSSSQSKNIKELSHGIDSLERINNQSLSVSYEPLLRTSLFTYMPLLAQDTVAITKFDTEVSAVDSMQGLSTLDLRGIYGTALNKARSSKNSYSFDERISKDTVARLYQFKVEWHRKLSMPVAVMIFFLIGAPLGAIIRKGGLGTPIVVSVLFFVVYYIVSITGEKMAREGTWESYSGMWISTFILLPIAIYLTYKATNDSNLLNSDWYYSQYKRLAGWATNIKAVLKTNKK